MSRITILSFVAASALATLTGCSSIRVVQKTPAGGTVALEGAEGGAREKADEYMRSQCPAGYEIVEEGEAVVTDTREWHITFKCRGAGNVGMYQLY